MFGKYFASCFTGSMYGAGVYVHAVWAYVIGNKDGGDFVELNPRIVAAALGGDPAEVTRAIEVLCAPDPESRSKAEGGRRLLPAGPFTYFVVNGEKYRRMRDSTARQAYMREYMRTYRAEKKAPTSCKPANKHALAQEEVEEEEETEKEKTKTPRAPRAARVKLVTVTSSDPRFDSWYDAYPRPEARKDALRAWGKLTEANRAECIARSPAWNAAKAGTERRFIPKAATYLNGERWRDPLVEPGTKAARGAAQRAGLDEERRKVFADMDRELDEKGIVSGEGQEET